MLGRRLVQQLERGLWSPDFRGFISILTCDLAHILKTTGVALIGLTPFACSGYGLRVVLQGSCCVAVIGVTVVGHGCRHFANYVDLQWDVLAILRYSVGHLYPSR